MLKQLLIKPLASSLGVFLLTCLLTLALSDDANAQSNAPALERVEQAEKNSVTANTNRSNQAEPSMRAFFERVLPGVRLVGSGELRFFGFKIYDAQLWVERREGLVLPKDPAKLLEQSFALDLRYARNLKGEEIAERSLEEMRRLGLGDDPQKERWLAAMKRVFRNVVKGDHITGIYKPGAATRFFLNEKYLGSIDEPDFGPAFFSIWFDARTRAPGLREALMKAPN